MDQQHPRFRACHSCRRAHRKCVPECLMRYHFPAGSEARHDAVHYFLGYRRTIRRIQNRPFGERFDILTSLIWEAQRWQQDPIGGPYVLYRNLEIDCDHLMDWVNLLEEQLGDAAFLIHELQQNGGGGGGGGGGAGGGGDNNQM